MTAPTLPTQPTDLAPALLAQLQALNIRPTEYLKILRLMGREPNFTELCMFSALWSEHCSYKHTKHLLKKLPTTGDCVVCGPGENAGIVALAPNVHIAFKVESHNHPTFVEPYQGAATGVGGILRDIITLNARPLGLLNALRFGPQTNPDNRRRLSQAVAGIAHYGNCMGVPTLAGDVKIEPCYAGNPLVNAMALGIMQPSGLIASGAKAVGHPVLYAGSPTGRDGMGGASFASKSFEGGDTAEADRPAVQVGDPFAEKCVMEACLQAFATGAILAAQDMGAAGLTCATAEMAAKGETGMRIDLDAVPAREPHMLAWEYLLSESQERMMMVVDKDRLAEIEAIFAHWSVPTAVIGHVTAEPDLVITHQGQEVVRLQATWLTDMAPEYAPSGRPEEPTERKAHRDDRNADEGLPPLAWGGVPKRLTEMMSHANVASRKPVFAQYDRHVRNHTRLTSDHHGVGVLALGQRDVPEAHAGLGLGVNLEGNPRWQRLQPYTQTQALVAQCARSLAAAGATPLAVTNNLNFGDPEDPAVYHQLYYGVEGLKDACLELHTPVTGGNVSLYNKNGAEAIWPSTTVGMVGRFDDVNYAVPAVIVTPPAEELTLAVLGRFAPSVGGSVYQAMLAQQAGLCDEPWGQPPSLIMREEALMVKVLAALHAEHRAMGGGLLVLAKNLGTGGLLSALVEATFAETGITCGLAVDVSPLVTEKYPLATALFGETHGCVLLAYPTAHAQRVSELVAQALQGRGPAPHTQLIALGHTVAETRVTLACGGEAPLTLPLEELATTWQQGLTI